MDSNDRELSGDSDLYQNAIRTKVINESKYESHINQIVEARFAYNYRYEASWKSLSEEGEFSRVNGDRVRELRNMDSVRLGREVKSSGHTWKAEGSAEIILELKLEVELQDGEKIEFVTQHTFSTISDAEPVGELIKVAEDNGEVDIKINEKDTYTLRLNDGSEFTGLESRGYYDDFSIEYNDTDDVDLLIEYLSYGKKWVKGITRKPIESDNSIGLPVRIEDNSLRFEYHSPETNEDFWDVVEVLGGGNPLLVDKKDVYISHSIFCSNEQLMTNGTWVVRKKEPRKLTSIFARIRKLF